MKTTAENIKKLTDVEHWNNYYNSQIKNKRQSIINLKSYIYMQFDAFFSELFKKPSLNRNMSILELGCGNSKWLPYFKKRFGFDVYGIDYSSKGVELAKKNLEINGLNGGIFLSDMLNPRHNDKKFDVVVSFGLIEHFNDTRIILEKQSDYVKKNGLLIGVVPNLLGINGKFSYFLQRELYFKHKVISSEDLKSVFKQCGYSELKCEYIGIFNLDVIDWNNLSNVPDFFRKPVRMVGKMLQLLARKLITMIGIKFESKVFSPYVICAGTKKY